jgi:hypothetical protein
MGTRLGELALWRRLCRLGAASARRIGRSLRSRARILGLCAGAIFGRTAAAHILRAGLSALGHPAHNKYRQSHRSRAWRPPGGQSGNSTGLHRPRKRRAGPDLSGAPEGLRLDSWRGRRGANQSRRVASSAGRPAWSTRWPGTAWHCATAAPASCFHSAHHNGDSAERCGDCSAAARQKRAGTIGCDSAARGSGHNTSDSGASGSTAAALNASWSARGTPHDAWRTARWPAKWSSATTAERRAANSAASAATSGASTAAAAASAATAAASRTATATRRAARALWSGWPAKWPARWSARWSAAASTSAAAAGAAAASAATGSAAAATTYAAAAATRSASAATAAAGCAWARTAATGAASSQEAAAQAGRGGEKVATTRKRNGRPCGRPFAFVRSSPVSASARCETATDRACRCPRGKVRGAR